MTDHIPEPVALAPAAADRPAPAAPSVSLDPSSFIPHPSSLIPCSSTGDLFRTDHLHDDLKGRSVRGGAATLGGQAANFVLKLGSTAVLARLLTPADYGLIAMVTAVTGFVEIFKDAGLSMATVQQAQINHRQISTLFWFNLGLSLLLMLVVIALAPGVAWFYGEPQLLLVTIALGAMFPLGGLTIQHGALLRRQMRFGTLASIDVASNVVGVAAGITAAAFGARYWALVAMMAASGVASAALVWITCPWLPSLPRRGTGVRPMLNFGVNLSLAQLLILVRRNGDNILLGSFWGALSLGLYTKAYQLLLFPLQQFAVPFNAVAIPVLCRLQSEPRRFRSYYLRLVEILATFTMPMVAFTFVSADAVIISWLGGEWAAVIPIFRALIGAGIVAAISDLGASVFQSLGRTDKQLRANLYAGVFFVAAFFVGLQWGAIGMAAAVSVAFCIALPCVTAYAFWQSPLNLLALGTATWRPLLAATSAGAMAWAVSTFCFRLDPGILKLFADSAVFFPSYLLTWTVLPDGASFLVETAFLVHRHLRVDRGTRSPRWSNV